MNTIKAIVRKLLFPFQWLFSLLFIPLAAIVWLFSRDLGSFLLSVSNAFRLRHSIKYNKKWWMEKKVRAYEQEYGVSVSTVCPYFWASLYMLLPKFVRRAVIEKAIPISSLVLMLLFLIAVASSFIYYSIQHNFVTYQQEVKTNFTPVFYYFFGVIPASILAIAISPLGDKSESTPWPLWLLFFLSLLYLLPIIAIISIDVLLIVAAKFSYHQFCPVIERPKARKKSTA